MSKIDLISNEWTDLVFEGRNQAYGAYKLRKGTTKRNVWSIIIVALAAVLLFLGLQLQKMAQANKTVENTQAVELARLQEKAIGSFNVEGNDEVGGAVLKAKEEIKAPEPPKHEEETKIFTVVEQMPLFPGGDAALMAYLRDNIHYPTVAAENGVQGRVVVGFVVERDGSITDVNVLRSVDPSLDREAMRVVKGMPRWTPGKQNGSAVRVKYQVPVTFRLQ